MDLALCRSALYEALVLGFLPPTAEAISRLASSEGVAALADAAAELDKSWNTNLSQLIHRLTVSPILPSPDALGVSFRRLFGHTARGLVPPYETEYGEDSLFQPLQEMSDLAGFCHAFGLGLRPSEHERIDHIACECEFMLFLARKEAYALVMDDATMLEETRRATRLFLKDHLGRWAPAFGRRLAREDRGRFYGALGELLATFVTSECARVGVPAGPELLHLRSTSLSDAPMACGSGDELLQIESPMVAESHPE
ncbi:MAG: molecular chaperone TorD family protein [candidate division NC10 bacterium]|nr:molecular chaperone TorD family protein [candidate division NC10 bacterium]